VDGWVMMCIMNYWNNCIGDDAIRVGIWLICSQMDQAENRCIDNVIPSCCMRHAFAIVMWNNPSLDCYWYHLAFLRSIHSFPSILLVPWIYCTAAMTSSFLLFISDPFESNPIQSSQPRDGPHEIRAITLFENTCILIHQSVRNFNTSTGRDLPKAAAPATRSERRARTRILYKMIMIWWWWVQ
jgi:hypothetical protein